MYELFGYLVNLPIVDCGLNVTAMFDLIVVSKFLVISYIFCPLYYDEGSNYMLSST